jgi:hypothetical protein
LVIVEFQGDKIAPETVYDDHATVLQQARLLAAPSLPVLGAEAARSLLEPIPLNQLLHRAER